VQKVWFGCRSHLSARRTSCDSSFGRGRAAHRQRGTIIQANLSGYNLVLVAAIETRYYFLVFVRPDISRLEQLKGKKLGISGFGSNTHYAALILLKHLNLEPNKDVALLPGGPDAERLGAMVAGKIDATLFNLSSAPVAKIGRASCRERVEIEDVE